MRKTRDPVELARIARLIRAHIVRMVGIDQKGHLGGSCSAADIVTALYFSRLRFDPARPDWPDRDRSPPEQGPQRPRPVPCLAVRFFLKRELLRQAAGALLRGTRGGPHPGKANTGSLGRGISMACGMTAGLRLDGRAAESASSASRACEGRYGRRRTPLRSASTTW
jgi:transketolase